jgi:hypothetical protein
LRINALCALAHQNRPPPRYLPGPGMNMKGQDMETEMKIAVLIDAENIASKYTGVILNEANP